MARIDALPSLEIIRGLKGILDFYVWRGLPCVRAWPKYRPAKQTAASLAAALVFGAIVKAYSLLGDVPLEAYRQDALDQPRTARDIMVTGVYGNLHEASMSDFLTLLTESRDFLSDLTALLNALDSIDTDELVVNVDQSVLPPLAATTTNQATVITALEKLDDLQDALESKALDRLIVRGEDQLFSLKNVHAVLTSTALTGGDRICGSPTVPANTYWLITNICFRNLDRNTTALLYHVLHNAVTVAFDADYTAQTQNEWSSWKGQVLLDPGDRIRLWNPGGNIGDSVQITHTGYDMTLET